MTLTYVVELTPSGRAAVAVVLVAGPESLRVVGESFAPVSGRPLSELPFGRIALGHWGGAAGEELIVCRWGDTEIEIHCHGGAAAVQAIVERLAERGCRRVSWRDWLESEGGRASPTHSSISGLDSITRAAQIALAEAATARTAGILLDQYHGALSDAIRSASNAIESTDWSQAAETLENLLHHRELGLHLTCPWRVVLAGAPNVGKSSLINALAGYERAIVSPQPGTTRDVVTTVTAIAGWPVQLADTAGLRASADDVESAGVALATGAIQDADLVVVVEDIRNEATAIAAKMPPTARVLHVQNKLDLLDARNRPLDSTNNAIATSAITGAGLPELAAAIAQSLVPSVPPAGAAVPFTMEQIAGIAAALASVRNEDAGRARGSLHALLTI